jgi:hypothetical protein
MWASSTDAFAEGETAGSIVVSPSSRDLPVKIACAVLISLACVVGAVSSRATEIGILRSCSFGAFVTDSDPAGLNVRAGPDVSSPIVGKLPPPALSDDDPPIRSFVEVEVVAAQNGWFRIRNARDNALLAPPGRKVFNGAGWVSGRHLSVKSQAPMGRDVASARGRPVRAAVDFDSDSFVRSARLHDCVGQWALVSSPEHRFSGWLNRICATQETSCDGV